VRELLGLHSPQTGAVKGEKVAPSPGRLKNRLLLSILGFGIVLTGFILPEFLTHHAFPGQAAPVEQTAQENKLAYQPPDQPEPSESAALLLRLALGTILVLGLCAASLTVAKRWLIGAPSRPNGDAIIQLLETLPLGNTCFIHLVRIGNQQVLAGVDRAGLKSLMALPEPFEAALRNAESSREDAAPAANLIVPIRNQLG